jgi:hypothetical protein
MGDQVDKRVLGELRVLRNPITDALDAVVFEDFDGVIAETGFESFEFAIVAVVSPELVDACLRQGTGGQQRE